ncbi:MAG: response regulator [Chitinivibrionales bacterium]|nr:response regulator [Chitinivibrionales bacterium]
MFEVLVIEENVATRDILKNALSRLGCHVTVSDFAEKAMELLEKIRFDVIFADLCMRNISARSLARWVRQRVPETKFFIVTGWKGELDQRMLQLDGIHAVLHKPLIFSKIRDKIIEHLG